MFSASSGFWSSLGGWTGEGGTLQTGEHFAQSIFHFFDCYINMSKGAFSLVPTSNGWIWHYKFDLNVKKAMFLFPFKVGVNVNLNAILRGLKKR